MNNSFYTALENTPMYTDMPELSDIHTYLEEKTFGYVWGTIMPDKGVIKLLTQRGVRKEFMKEVITPWIENWFNKNNLKMDKALGVRIRNGKVLVLIPLTEKKQRYFKECQKSIWGGRKLPEEENAVWDVDLTGIPAI